jgi:predicted RNase H-related nuclease YkuK (DUF458 family)
MYEAEIVPWHTGSGYEISLNEVKEQLAKHISDGGKLFIGCDSFLNSNKCVFATALCLHGRPGQQGGTYFWYRRNIHAKKYQNFGFRMFQEAYNALGLALWLTEQFPDAEVEIHIDISSDPDQKSFKYGNALSGMIKGAGYTVKRKPNAWAANAVADKHSK